MMPPRHPSAWPAPRVLCVDGVKGLLTGSVLYRLGAEGAGHVVHLYPRSGDERGSSAGNLSSVERLNLEQAVAGSSW